MLPAFVDLLVFPLLLVVGEAQIRPCQRSVTWRTSPSGQGLPSNSAQILVRRTPNDLPDPAEAGHSPFVPTRDLARAALRSYTAKLQDAEGNGTWPERFELRLG
jgi:hypothetical protein